MVIASARGWDRIALSRCVYKLMGQTSQLVVIKKVVCSSCWCSHLTDMSCRRLELSLILFWEGNFGMLLASYRRGSASDFSVSFGISRVMRKRAVWPLHTSGTLAPCCRRDVCFNLSCCIKKRKALTHSVTACLLFLKVPFLAIFDTSRV